MSTKQSNLLGIVTAFFFLLYVLFLALSVLLNWDLSLTKPEKTTDYNLIPFYRNPELPWAEYWDNVINGIMVFIPIGLYIPLIFSEWRSLKILALGCAISMGLEISQYELQKGQLDLTDVCSNTVGVAIGMGLLFAAFTLLKDKNHISRLIAIALNLSVFFLWYISSMLLVWG